MSDSCIEPRIYPLGDTAIVCEASPPATLACQRRVWAAAQAARGAVETIADVDNEVRGSLDDLKNNIFRLELRRQAGTISEDDYARERARVEKALRDLVQG